MKGLSMTIPQLSSEQLGAAREAATQARRARAELKDQVKNGDLTFNQALDKAVDDDTLSRIKVIDLLRAMPRVGVTRATEIMENLQIAPNRRIRGLGRHQVMRLNELFN
ncbi:30S ribosomal protein S13 [Tessaracoccus flavescens]|uniref:30S ribosomal protein S13 n=2 Tax=Tessaracoccus flavescens TaxID=399497 RepID=A0A1Q2D2P6_9ACTN|nr:30S ribosomal protein S13 [Tessaracoccus flavescens]